MPLELPDLTIPDDTRGKGETTWDLAPLMYRGGAAVNVREVQDMIVSGKLGKPLPERLELVRKIHEVILGKQARGVSKKSLGSDIVWCRTCLFKWADENNKPLTFQKVAETYMAWSESLVNRVRVEKNLSASSGYTYASIIGNILDTVLGRDKPIVQLTRLRRPKQRKTAQGVEADKQNLEQTFQFGSFVQDICDGLTLDVLLGPLPAKIPLRQGGVLEQWSGLIPEQSRVIARRDTPHRKKAAKKSDKTRAAYEADKTLRTRYPLANLRIMAEMMMFIGQTGMNLTQAYKLKLSNFHFSSYLDGYQVKKNYKNRKGGEVMFEVFHDYRPHFERYLAWRRKIFPDSDRLFPFVTFGRALHKDADFRLLKKACFQAGVRFIPARLLRGTRINWLLRRSGDPDLTAEMAQSAKKILFTNYDRPSFQKAMTETIRFWSKMEQDNSRTTPAAPGECDGNPEPVAGMPKNATQPDCVQQSGCLWCTHHRDIDSQDYVWALACFHHLKSIELSRFRGEKKAMQSHPASLAIDRIVDKLHWFKESNALRKGWVDEAMNRVEEGYYHPDWKRLIERVEGVAA